MGDSISSTYFLQYKTPEINLLILHKYYLNHNAVKFK